MVSILPGMANTEIVAQRDERTGRFLTGNNGGGRKPGSRVRHSENFLREFADDFEQHGAEVIAKVRVEKPDGMCSDRAAGPTQGAPAIYKHVPSPDRFRRGTHREKPEETFDELTKHALEKVFREGPV